MSFMRPRQIATFSVVLALLTAVAGGLSLVDYGQTLRTSAMSVMITRFFAVLIFGGFGLAVAQQSQMRGSLFLKSEEWRLTLRDLLIFGVLPGLALGVINYLFFFAYRYSPFVEPRIRDMNSIYDSFVISLDSGLFEEVIFRLFIMSCFVFSFRHLYAKITFMWPVLVAIIPTALSLVLSSLLFAMVHNVYGFTAAFFGGVLLGLIYLRSGIESAIAAHFFANFFFFSASYLS